jgi:hypothetical protein
MNPRGRSPVLGLLLTLLSVLGSAGAGPDERHAFRFDGGRRTLTRVGRDRWGEYEGDRLKRLFAEQRRTADFVELYTNDPVPTWVRVRDDRLDWRPAREKDWRPGKAGQWEPPPPAR